MLLIPCLGVSQNKGLDQPIREESQRVTPLRPTQPLQLKEPPKTVHHASTSEKREADDAYLEGAREFDHKHFEKAEHCFERAVQLDPDNRTYALALLYARETNVNGLIQSALKARLQGDSESAERILASTRSIDPTNPLVMQYAAKEVAAHTPASHLSKSQSDDIEGPIQFAPFGNIGSFHLHDEPREVIRQIYGAFGIATVFDPSVVSGKPLRIDVDNVDFLNVSRILRKAAHLLIVPLDSTTALIAADTKDNREALTPLVEETIYLPSLPQQQMLDLANVARGVFELTQVGVSTKNGAIVVRGPQPVVRRVDEVLEQLTNHESDVVLDINIYEMDKTTTRKIGFVPPTSASATNISSAAQKLISDNQTLLNESISSGALSLSGTTYEQELQEVAFLVAAGVSGSSTFTSILGTLGSYDGIPLLGISMSSTSFNMLLSATDARILNAVQIRSKNQEEVTFRVGSRYPILTAVTTYASSSSVASELAAAGVSSSVISQIVGSSSSSSGTSTPQIQFEDIGLTLKVTPRVLRNANVQLSMDLKLESLGGTGVNDIPILNNRALKSTVTVAAGETTMLTALVTTNEIKALDGIPGLDQLPGFQSTDKNSDGTKDQLLITVTPHIVSGLSMRVEMRELHAQ
ncbi:type II secretory protein PulD [Terriglobus sp. RCC_193]|uniref:type II secretory protein PulD n=1 Tax=Terriglobus sp. RCC_193 TaxID=3239218 RepID=UPI003525C56E